MAQSAPTEPLKPFTVVVVDGETGMPIPAFDYFYYVEAASGYKAGEQWRWTSVLSAAGEVRLDLPVSCQLTFSARLPGYVWDTFFVSHYAVKADDPKRQIKHALQRGITVSGRVVDAATSQPVAGVRVSPMVFWNPGSSPDHDRSVFSGADGRFEITGISPTLGSIGFEHTDYLQAEWYSDYFEPGEAKPHNDITVEITAGEAIFGVVRGPDGKPIEGATVESGSGKKVQTAADGSFRITGEHKSWSNVNFYVNVKRTGYMEYWRTPHEIPEGGLQITLQPLFEIRGHVVGPDGRPPAWFRVFAGPGKNPADWECVGGEFCDGTGRFSIAIDTRATWLGGTFEDDKRIEPRHWLSVWASGSAQWEGLIPYDAAGADVTVKLKQGVTIFGRLSGLPKGFGGGEILLVPERVPREYSSKETGPQKYGLLRSEIPADGRIWIGPVRPDKYTLRISGHGITSRVLTFEVPGTGLDMGSIEVQGTGRVVGQVFRREGEPWGFADCVLWHKTLAGTEGRKFKATESGGFVLDDAPAGEVSIGAQYLGGDMIWSDDVYFTVVPGGEVNAIINNPDHSHDVKFRIDIGDGSEPQRKTGTGRGAGHLVENVTTRDPQFRIDLDPLSGESQIVRSGGAWLLPDSDGVVTVPGVPPGKYRVRVLDWQGSIGVDDGLLYQSEIEVKVGAEPFHVPLGAGAITGRLRTLDIGRYWAQVMAVEVHGRTHPHYASCDQAGRFCVRYLPPGEYVIYGHDHAKGYCRLPAVRVSDDVRDVGEHFLSPGSTIHGTIRVLRPVEPPTIVRATDGNGVTLDMFEPHRKPRNGGDYAFMNLWPGTWTLSLMRDRDVLARKTVTIEGTPSMWRATRRLGMGRKTLKSDPMKAIQANLIVTSRIRLTAGG